MSSMRLYAGGTEERNRRLEMTRRDIGDDAEIDKGQRHDQHPCLDVHCTPVLMSTAGEETLSLQDAGLDIRNIPGVDC